MLEKMFVFVFDLVKRIRMDLFYIQIGDWGRKQSIGDIVSAVDLVRGRQYDRALDLGTGLGHYAELIAPFCERVYATDISQLALDMARDRIPGIKNIVWMRMNARHLHFDPFRTFDLVVLGDMIYYLGDRRYPKAFADVIDGIIRHTRFGGRILLSNFVSGPGRDIAEAQRYVDEFVDRGLLVEEQKVYEERGKRWLQTVIRRV